jgi:hypothetical protein
MADKLQDLPNIVGRIANQSEKQQSHLYLLWEEISDIKVQNLTDTLALTTKQEAHSFDKLQKYAVNIKENSTQSVFSKWLHK